jgi:hypothetical protein
MRVIVFGMMGRCPFGGQTWLSLNWLRAFHRLGHDVWYVEDDSRWPYDPLQHTFTEDTSYALTHISTCLERIGLGGKWAYRFAESSKTCWGLSATALNELYRTCDVLFTFGTTVLRDEHLAAPYRVYIESDPVMSQLRLANGDAPTLEAFRQHQAIFTYGENYGAVDCGVPLCGVRYQTTRQPIDLELWYACFTPDATHFTTIGNYRQKGNDIAYNGDVYSWSKHHEWAKFIELPQRTTQPMELATYLDRPADREELTGRGWRVVSPYEMSLDIFGAYPDYIRRSRAEFTVAKDQNVRLRSGWFSERDACYLASGKPVIAQDTGFGNRIPTGEGLFAVSTIDQALTAIDAINSDYARHCRMARAIAEEYFEATAVADRLIGQLDSSEPPIHDQVSDLQCG